jgi:anti-sigma B factor antagonist
MPDRSVTTIPAGFAGADTYVIRIAGELDVASCEDLRVALHEAESSDAQRILLDLEGLVSLDAAALHVMLKAARRSAGNGGRLKVTRGNGHVTDLFRVSALSQVLSFARETA